MKTVIVLERTYTPMNIITASLFFKSITSLPGAIPAAIPNAPAIDKDSNVTKALPNNNSAIRPNKKANNPPAQVTPIGHIESVASASSSSLGSSQMALAIVESVGAD